MKKAALTLFVCLSALLSFSQTLIKKQTLIPLSNVNGVPFYKDKELNDLIINGFEIDNKGNYYFFGGDNLACLAAFNGNKQIYRKTYKELNSGSTLHIYKNSFYSFTFDKNGKFVYIKINVPDGSISYMNNQLIPKHFLSHEFVDSCVILNVHYANPTGDYFEQYTLAGQFIKRVANMYGVPFFSVPKDAEFLGTWGDKFVFWNVLMDHNGAEQLLLVSKDGKILSTKILPEDGFSGEGYGENPQEDRKIRNGNLYVLGRKGKYTMITEMSLKSFFGQ